MKIKNLTGPQVLARMKRGDRPCMVGAGGSTAVFWDGRKAARQTMRRLEKAGKVDRPVGTSISCMWTLPSEGPSEVPMRAALRVIEDAKVAAAKNVTRKGGDMRRSM